MNAVKYFKVVLAGCLSCFLGACIAAGPGEEGSDESVVVSTEEEGMNATAVDPGELGGEETDATGCTGYGNWCLAKCSKSGDTQHVVGKWNALGGVCATPAEAYCKQKGLGYRTHACWGYVNNN
jgi:hypothetical protein